MALCRAKSLTLRFCACVSEPSADWLFSKADSKSRPRRLNASMMTASGRCALMTVERLKAASSFSNGSGEATPLFCRDASIFLRKSMSPVPAGAGARAASASRASPCQVRLRATGRMRLQGLWTWVRACFRTPHHHGAFVPRFRALNRRLRKEVYLFEGAVQAEFLCGRTINYKNGTWNVLPNVRLEVALDKVLDVGVYFIGRNERRTCVTYGGFIYLKDDRASLKIAESFCHGISALISLFSVIQESAVFIESNL